MSLDFSRLLSTSLDFSLINYQARQCSRFGAAEGGIKHLPFSFGVHLQHGMRLIVLPNHAQKVTQSTIYLDVAKNWLVRAGVEHPIELAPATLKAVLKLRLSCTKMLPNYAAEMAMTLFINYTRTALRHILPAGQRLPKGLRQLLTGILPVSFPPVVTVTEIQRRVVWMRIITLHYEVNWITNSVGGYPVGREHWGALGEEEVRVLFASRVNEEINRLRRLYQQLQLK